MNNQWIPVSERLPSKNGLYLVSLKNLTGYCTTKHGVIFCNYDNGDWYFDGWEDNKVVAWMPLPEPYKGGSQNE